MEMNIKQRGAFAAAALLIMLGSYTVSRLNSTPDEIIDPAPPPVQTSGFVDRDGRYMFAITLHTPEAIDALLTRAEQLATDLQKQDHRTGIALVLHGPEVEYFSNKHYGRYKSLVDKAARLNASGTVEIKICQTQMRFLGIKEDEIPDFVELVPFGPDEIKRLERSGYVYL